VIFRYIGAMRKSVLIAAAMLATALPAAAQERQWSLDATDQDAFLVFGVPETEDVGLSFWCAIQSGKSKIFLPSANERLTPGHSGAMSIMAGDVTAKLEGTVSQNDETGAPSLEAEIPTSHPLFAALRKADRMHITVLGEDHAFPLADADFDGLLKLCDKP
jgi:hypothetical protein